MSSAPRHVTGHIVYVHVIAIGPACTHAFHVRTVVTLYCMYGSTGSYLWGELRGSVVRGFFCESDNDVDRVLCHSSSPSRGPRDPYAGTRDRASANLAAARRAPGDVRVRIAYKYTIAIRVMRNYCRITETRIPSNTFFKHIMLQ